MQNVRAWTMNRKKWKNKPTQKQIQNYLNMIENFKNTKQAKKPESIRGNKNGK